MPLNLTRSLLWIILPGWVAVFPWLLAIGHLYPAVKDGYTAYTSLYQAAAFSVVVVAGSVFQAIASYIEPRFDESLESSKSIDVREEWFKYLSHCLENEPVGYRYISRCVTSMKYELAMVTAVPVSLIGAAVFLAGKGVFSFGLGIIAALLTSLVAIYVFHRQAKDTHTEINSVRAEINKRIGVAIDGLKK